MIRIGEFLLSLVIVGSSVLACRLAATPTTIPPSPTQNITQPAPSENVTPTSVITDNQTAPTPTDNQTPIIIPTPVPTPTPIPVSPYSSIQVYLDKTSPELRQIILGIFLRDNYVSPTETNLIRKLTNYQFEDQKQIVDAGLVDENFPARDPDIVLDRLASPPDVVFYLDNFFTYSLELPITYKPARMIIQEGKGSCSHYAQIAAESLRRHGYIAWNMGIDITSPSGHNVGAYEAYESNDLIFVIRNGTWARNSVYAITRDSEGRGSQGATLLGPYPSYRSVGIDFENMITAPKGMGDFRLLDPFAIQNPVPNIGILNLPWQRVK